MISLQELTIGTEEFEQSQLLSSWAWRMPQHLQPLFLSTFGDWFFRDGEDRILMFDLVSGELKQIADSKAEFEALLELEDYQREWLMSQMVEQLHQLGIKRAAGQCYAFRTPPMLGGQLLPSNIVLWDLEAYQTGTSKVHQQLGGLPFGTHVVAK